MAKGLLLIVLATLAVGVQLADAAWREVLTAITAPQLDDPRFDSSVRATGPCLEFFEGTANGQSATARLWDCSNRWDGKLTQTDHTVGYEDTTGWAWIRHRHNNVDYCLDVAEGKAFDGAAVRWWKCNGSRAQAWYLPTGKDKGQVRSDLNFDLCLQGAVYDPWVGSSSALLQLSTCEKIEPGQRPDDRQQFDVRMGKGFSNGASRMNFDCNYKKSLTPGLYCSFTCKPNWLWKHYLYEGVTYSCRRAPQEWEECMSSLDPAEYRHDSSPGISCECKCQPWLSRDKSIGGSPVPGLERVGGKPRAVAPVAAAPTLAVGGAH
ncbi:hypothetical protein H9P43_007176 [Blastocladiella emersonii ATCC 22665]|nr:hypothetical protein H9P43_007176 [Blastocladiella emersonii ATCC 22665]